MTLDRAIRPFRRTDAADLARLHGTAMTPLGQRGWTEGEIASLAQGPGGFGLVAEEPGPPRSMLGFVLARVIAGEAEILTIAVASAARRRGVASMLLEAVVAEARSRGAIRLLLEVSVENAPALALYERGGFAAVGIRHGYYNVDGVRRVDALVLARGL